MRKVTGTGRKKRTLGKGVRSIGKMSVERKAGKRAKKEKECCTKDEGVKGRKW